MTLRMRLILSISAVLILSVAVGGVLVYWHAAHKLRTELQASIAVGGRVALNALHGIEFFPEGDLRLKLLVADFDGDRHLRASVLDKSGAAIAASTPQSPEEPVPDWFYRLLAGEPLRVHLRYPAVGEGHTILLETDAANELSEVWSDIKLALQVLSLFCALVLALVYWTLARGLRPLNDLTAAFSRIGEGDYGVRLVEQGSAELARVAAGFNRMAGRLAKMEVQNRRLHEQLAVVQEEERSELARDLHDDVGPLLFAVDADASTLQSMLRKGSKTEIAARIASMREAIGRTQKQVREILGRLRSPMVDDLGLSPAIENLVQFWRQRRPEVRFSVVTPPEGLGATLDRAIYRIVQESVSNALRHGRPSSIEILVLNDPGGAVLVRVTDDGGGLRQSREATGYGVIGMRERVTALGGRLEVDNASGGSGVVVSAELPTAPEASEPKVAAE